MSRLNPNQPPFGAPDYEYSAPTNVDLAGNFRESKPGIGGLEHGNTVAETWNESEPLITPAKLKRIHLFGLPLVSAIVDPLTTRPQIMDDELIKDFIIEAVSLAETESNTEIMSRQHVESEEFDRVAFQHFGFLQLRRRPVSSIEALTITASNEQRVFETPLEWISTSYLHQGRIYLLPLIISNQNGRSMSGASAIGTTAAFFTVFSGRSTIASFWECRYTSGYKDGQVSRLVNQYIGTIAAMEIISALAATYSRSTSSSLSADGLSQSISSPGPELFTQRLSELGSKRKYLCGKLKAQAGSTFKYEHV